MIVSKGQLGDNLFITLSIDVSYLKVLKDVEKIKLEDLSEEEINSIIKKDLE